MDFDFTAEQQLVRKTVRDFAEKELTPKALELDNKRELPRDIIKKAAKMGLIGVIIPEEYGGSPMGHVARMISIEEISRACGSMGLFLQATPLGLWAILRFGTEEQKEKYIPSVVSGDKIMCMAVTEPTGGSDPSAMETTAKHIGRKYVVNGRKCFITNGSTADYCVLAARTGEGPRGLSVFVVEKGTAGFEPGRVERHAGFAAIDVAELFFSDCIIPEQNLVGDEGQGLSIALTSIFEIGRVGNAAVSLGIARAAKEAAVRFAKERNLYGRPIAELQAIQFLLADMDMEIEAARWLAYHTAWLLDQGKTSREISKEICRAKAYASEVARRAAINAIQIHGACGTLPDFHVIRYLRDALEGVSSAGTNEIMRLIIARELMRD